MDLVSPTAIMTVEEAAQHLKLKNAELLSKAMDAGRLAFIEIESERRIVGRDFNDYVNGQRCGGAGYASIESAGSNAKTNGLLKHATLQLKSGHSFVHKWPDGTPSKFVDVQEGSIQTTSGIHAIKIGTTRWKAAEEERDRRIVFIDGRPIVEFVAANGSVRSGLMASLIKIGRKQIRPEQGIPSVYKHLHVEPYNTHVQGKYASSNLAVVCKQEDINSMVEHAVLRLEDLHRRKRQRRKRF